MINDFADLCLWSFVLVDDLWPNIAPYLKRPGPQPECSDSELVTIILISECMGWDKETDLLYYWQQHSDLFPHLPERSRFNRRRRNLCSAINLLRQRLLHTLDLALERQFAIDSLPVPVMAFHLVPAATTASEWKAYGVRYGYCASKKQHIFGYKLHLLVTLNGVICDYILAPANQTDLAVASDWLFDLPASTIVADKGYISAPLRAALAAQDTKLLTVPRSNQHEQISKQLREQHARVRQIIETVNSQLAGQFKLQCNYAHTFIGLCARLHGKLTAHTLLIKLNRLLGKAKFLQLKSLAFVNN